MTNEDSTPLVITPIPPPVDEDLPLQPPPASSSSSVMGTEVEAGELFLHHSDHPNYVLSTSLLNEKNFSHWKRSVEVSLMAKNKLGFVTGDSRRPSPTSPQYGQWEHVNNMVISWLLHSIEKEIAESILYCKIASQIWKELQSRLGKSNRTRLFQVQRELSSISQGSSSVTNYFTKLKKIWDEYLLMIEDCICDCGSTMVMNKIIQDQQVVQFLMGLNENFAATRGNVLMINPPPTLNEVYHLILQEEEQKHLNESSKSEAEVMALASQRSREGQRQPVKYCDHCKVGGHTMDKCWKIHGYPPKSPSENTLFCEHCKVNNHSTERCFKAGKSGNQRQAQDTRFCDHCRVGGHTMDRCWKLHGYPPGKGPKVAAQASTTNNSNPIMQQQYEQLISLLQHHQGQLSPSEGSAHHATFLAGGMNKWRASFGSIWNTVIWIVLINFFFKIINSTAQSFLKKRQEEELVAASNN